MVFAECGACHGGIRVWDASRGGSPSADAASAPLSAVTDADRRWTCPSCGLFQTLLTGSVYVIYDRDERAVRYVGRSVDVQRRLDWWDSASNPFGDPARYRGVQCATWTPGFVPDVAWFGAPEAET